MKLQTAIDRVSLDEAVNFAKIFDGSTDILELGTSLVKDYGNKAIDKVSSVLEHTELLVDSKTIDEGNYEFTQAYQHGAEIVTAMGAASYNTLEICYNTSREYNKTIMIDLLEVNDTKMAELSDFEDAIFVLHHSADRKDKHDASANVAEFTQKFPFVKRIAVAGGIDLEQAKQLAKQGLTEIVIVGSKITKAEYPKKMLLNFKEGIQDEHNKNSYE